VSPLLSPTLSHCLAKRSEMPSRKHTQRMELGSRTRSEVASRTRRMPWTCKTEGRGRVSVATPDTIVSGYCPLSVNGKRGQEPVILVGLDLMNVGARHPGHSTLTTVCYKCRSSCRIRLIVLGSFLGAKDVVAHVEVFQCCSARLNQLHFTLVSIDRRSGIVKLTIPLRSP
jgi:hypothetical protein